MRSATCLTGEAGLGPDRARERVAVTRYQARLPRSGPIVQTRCGQPERLPRRLTGPPKTGPASTRRSPLVLRSPCEGEPRKPRLQYAHMACAPERGAPASTPAGRSCSGPVPWAVGRTGGDAGHRAVERGIERDGRIDERKVGECLREVPDLLAGKCDLLGVQADVVGVG